METDYTENVTGEDRATIERMWADGSTLRAIRDALPHIHFRAVEHIIFPHLAEQEIVSPEDRLLRAIFGD